MYHDDPPCDDDCNDNGHAITCDCETCMPPGSDGAMDDALAAAASQLAGEHIRGSYTVRPVAVSLAVSWSSPWGSRRDLDRHAMRTAERHLRARGLRASECGGEVFVRAA
jgi:hypothetical protein